MIQTFARRINGLFSRKAIVLMYHRVAEVKFDPWQLSVTPANFEEQLSVLQNRFNVIPLNDLVSQVINKKIHKDCICITFDDGYTDNFLNALPLLEKFNLPATFFIASKYIGSGSKFWWDELEHIILGSPFLPPFLNVVINNVEHKFELRDVELTAEQISVQKKWEWPDPSPNDRCRLYLDIWEKLLPLDFALICNVMDQIKKWAGYDDLPDPQEVPMKPQQLKTLLSNNLFDAGLHTNTHPALPFHSKEYQRNEVRLCKNYLQTNFQKTVNTIAYPYGRYDVKTIDAIKEEDLTAGFTTDNTIIKKGTDPFKMGRVQVCNWNGLQFERQLKLWSKN